MFGFFLFLVKYFTVKILSFEELGLVPVPTTKDKLDEDSGISKQLATKFPK